MIYPATQLRRILFLDIETASCHAEFDELSERLQLHWRSKSRRHVSAEDYPFFEEDLAVLYQEKAAIHAEFARVVCISVGVLTGSDDDLSLRIKSFSDSDEVALLEGFNELVNSYFFDRFNHFICGHNIKEFDVPFLCRRMMIHGVRLPNLLNIAGYKPWQTHHLLDTMEMWKYGDYKHYTSLDLLCEVLQVPTSKNEMNGSHVSAAFWDGRIEEIVTYCQQDVIATARVYQRCVGLDQIGDESINIIAATDEEE